LKIDSANPEALFSIGKILAREGYIKEAMDKWNFVVSNAPESEYAEKCKGAIGAARNWISIFE